MTHALLGGIALVAFIVVVLLASLRPRSKADRRASGRSGADRTRPASRGPPIRRSSGARPRTSGGRSRFPAAASASPVVWGDRVFVLTAVPVGVHGTRAHAPRGGLQPRGVARFVVLAIDRKTGKTIWERVARARNEPHEAAHAENGTWASSSRDHRRRARLA